MQTQYWDSSSQDDHYSELFMHIK